MEQQPKLCAPPTESSSVGYVMYAGTAAFIIPTILLTSIYIAIGCKMHGRQGKKVRRARKDLKTACKVNVMMEEHSKHVGEQKEINLEEYF